MGTHRSALRLASALCFGLLAWACGAERAPLQSARDGDGEEHIDDPIEEGADDPLDQPTEDDAGEPTAADDAAQAQAAAPSAPEAGTDPTPPAPAALPLPLCEKYFPQASPLPVLSKATMAFWAEDNCAVAGLFGDLDRTIDFLNYLRDWSLLILGCEAPHDVPGGVETFGPTYLLDGAPLAQADVDALIDHFMHTLIAALPLEPEDEARLRDALVQLSREVPLCDCPPQLDLCAEE